MEHKQKSHTVRKAKKKISTCADKTSQGQACYPILFKDVKFCKECGSYCTEHRRDIMRMIVDGVTVEDSHHIQADFEFFSITFVPDVPDITQVAPYFERPDRYHHYTDEWFRLFAVLTEKGTEVQCLFKKNGEVPLADIHKIIAYWHKIEIELSTSIFGFYRTDDQQLLECTIKFPSD